MKFLVPLGLAAVCVLAWHTQGWPGLALVGGGVVMWGLLHITRMVTVLQRAARQPVGWVASAVMLNAKLHPGLPLLHVLTLTRALGERVSAEGADPEVFRWTDGGGASVRAEFAQGKLVVWALTRLPAPQPNPPHEPPPGAHAMPTNRPQSGHPIAPGQP